MEGKKREETFLIIFSNTKFVCSTIRASSSPVATALSKLRQSAGRKEEIPPAHKLVTSLLHRSCWIKQEYVCVCFCLQGFLHQV